MLDDLVGLVPDMIYPVVYILTPTSGSTQNLTLHQHSQQPSHMAQGPPDPFIYVTGSPIFLPNIQPVTVVDARIVM